MKPAFYKDISSEDMPWIAVSDSCQIKAIAGTLEINGKTLCGQIPGPDSEALSTEPLIIDVDISAGNELSLPVNPVHNAFIYLFEGKLAIEDKTVPTNTAVILGKGEQLTVNAESDSRFLLLSGKPINEPIAQWGPFVMNTQEEIEQALQDYREGTLTN